jgi:membrane-bound lytic murein transglycosylase B
MHPGGRAGDPPPFETWRAALVAEAVGRGFDRRLAEEALGDLEPLPRVLRLDRTQSGTPPNLDSYLSERVTPALVAKGREMLADYEPVLGRIERAFGVQRRFLVAIWGEETGYGRYTGDVPVLQALATLAWDRRRSAYFRAEVFDALAILDGGHIARDRMTGSWAGAMGQPQFMPSSYLEYAVDFDQDGRRDIWGSVADTLASIAKYLQRYGWEPDTGWGMEVSLTADLRSRLDREIPRRTRGCGAVRILTEPHSLTDWQLRGVRGAGGAELPRRRQSASLVVLGRRAFLVSANYEAILGYNCSHRYALSVSMLADRFE